ncbi:MAG TPA: helix-turn-helix domain-containing protein [Rhabdochlamydiaceae bacterium]|nr:helix-turn-helix domain-containing protein [Rhabdochlamydiaceae bacterium]
MSKFFKDLKEGLEEAIEYRKGKKTLRSKTIEIPPPAKEYRAAEIKKIRSKGNYSQGVFARILNVSLNTVQAWETGNRHPNHAALRLLEIIDKGIYRPAIYRKHV